MKVNSYRLTRKAEDDLDYILEHYEKVSLRLEEMFKQEFEKSLQKILRNPQAYKLVDPKTRRFMMKTFPYNIFYGIKNEVLIVRIRGNRQKPLKRYT